MRVLHIIATPRATESNTLRVSDAFLERLRDRLPALEVDTFDLFTEPMPDLAGANTASKYALSRGEHLDPSHAHEWQRVEAMIEQFLAADVRLISSPMWNFSIPYKLKHYIDVIVQPGYLYAYNELGVPVGLATEKPTVCITSRGGDYSPGGPMSAFDLQEVYLRSVFGFVGITEMTFVNAQPMDITPDLREVATTAALAAARDVADALLPSEDPTPVPV